MTDDNARGLLQKMLEAAIGAADPARVLAPHLPQKPDGRCIVVGGGKSAASMARAVELAWPDVDLSGIVVTRYGHAVPTDRTTVREAAHPVPDAAAQAATLEVMEAAASAGPDDLVLALLSGGGSALLTLPRPPLTLDDLITVNRLLLSSGLSISEMNKVRRRLSQVKGGGLARAAGQARLVTLAISDVPGDDPEAIASGPTVPDPTAQEDLSYLVEKLGAALPEAAAEMLRTPSPNAANFQPDYRLIATPQASLDAAAEVARAAGVTPILLGDALEGESRELGTVMAGMAKAVARHGTPAAAPAVLISGGETTVTVGDRTPGRGGRNTEFLLSLALALDGHAGITAVAADTDGIDGTESAAGAIVDASFPKEAARLGINTRRMLEFHDSFTAFEQLGCLVTTGPTLTNVNDFRAIMVQG
ncbi:glycerate kinase [Oceanicola sp. D3]|uniref:glycerate kinase type-2 family protein n=1 Tax=Oceanicola sp. D3 TaxID=2587163 RepID=UPI00112000AC|nr:glycerate kinase [Oceanicola sp. D3]QDC10647.1 glycerate kinase [Oceanicola sp. D3]